MHSGIVSVPCGDMCCIVRVRALVKMMKAFNITNAQERSEQRIMFVSSFNRMLTEVWWWLIIMQTLPADQNFFKKNKKNLILSSSLLHPREFFPLHYH